MEKNETKKFIENYSPEEIKNSLTEVHSCYTPLERLIDVNDCVYGIIAESDDIPIHVKNRIFNLRVLHVFYRNLLMGTTQA